MDLAVAAGLTLIVAGVAWLLMIFLNRERIRQLDQITIGRRVAVDSFPYVILRATNYGFACTFDALARRTHPGVDFGRIPPAVKRPFRVMCLLHLVGLASLILGAAAVYG